MSDFYGEMADIAAELLAEFKQGVVTVVSVSQDGEKPADWPTWDPWTPPTVTRLYELDAVVQAVGLQGREGIALEDGSAVRATDLVVTCSNVMRLISIDGVAVVGEPEPLDVSLLDTLQIDGQSGTVMAVTKVPFAGAPVVQRLIFRG